MHAFVGDQPAPVRVEPVSVDLAPGSTAAAELVLASAVAQTLTALVDGDAIFVSLPVLAVVGKHALSITVNTPAGIKTLAPIPVVVEHEDGDGWYTLPEIRAEWSDAPVNDAVLYDLLAVARQQVEAFGPLRPLDAPVPVNYRVAQRLQARNLWGAGKTNAGSDEYGAQGFGMTVHPLDWHVRQLIRPRRGTPVVG